MAHTSETGLHSPLPARSYRYPGATPFSVEQEHIFFGRAQDTDNLFRLVRRETMVVLYGKSGLGKSSLINAGLIPRFREEGSYHPVSVRFYAHSEGSTESPLAKVKAALSEGFSGETFIDSLLPGDDSLWFHAKRRQLQGGGQPLLLFDQFEELFGYPDVEVNALQLQLAELRHTGLPLRLRRRLEDPLVPALSEEQEDLLEKPLDLRLLFAVRSDRLHLLNRLKDHLPFAMHQAYELQALLPEDAKEAIMRPAAAVGQSFATPAFAFSPEALNRLLDFLGDGQDGRVEGILLQMLCEYYERGQVEGKNGPVLLGLPEVGNPNDVVRNYYRKKISDLPAQNRAAASRLIEEGLVSESQGIRLSLHEANIASEYEVDATTLNALVDSRLLRAEPFPRGGYAYELSHDRLIPAVLEAREESRQAKAREEALRQEEALLQEKARREEAEAQRAVAEQAKRRATWFARGAGALALVAILLAVYAVQQSNAARIERDKAEKSAVEARVAKDSAEVQKRVADAQRLIANSNAVVAQKQTVLAELKTKEAEANLFKAQKEEQRALAALQQVQKEKAATEEQRRKAEENYRIAQAKTLEAEASAVKARQALAETQRALGEVVRLSLQEADAWIKRLDYVSALEKMYGLVPLGASKESLSSALMEPSFWYAETGDLSRAWGILDTAYQLVGRRLPMKGSKDLEGFRTALRSLDAKQDSFLQSRYFPRLVDIKGGDFTMGSENGENDEKPPHRVSISDFKVCVHEVTWWQYGLYVTANRERGVEMPEFPSSWGDISGDNPVVNVSWNDAVGYANWLSDHSGLEKVYKGLGTDNVEWEAPKRPGYRLPTEAEWEYAALGGKQQEWAGTNGEDSLGDYGWYDGNSGSRTRPVGGKKPNPFGLYDMSGNVWEWCWDRYGGYGEAAQSDPRGPSTGSNRVMRGGSWNGLPRSCRVANRSSDAPGYHGLSVGFRLARIF